VGNRVIGHKFGAELQAKREMSSAGKPGGSWRRSDFPSARENREGALGGVGCTRLCLLGDPVAERNMGRKSRLYACVGQCIGENGP